MKHDGSNMQALDYIADTAYGMFVLDNYLIGNVQEDEDNLAIVSLDTFYKTNIGD